MKFPTKVPSNLEVAREAKLLPIEEIADSMGIGSHPLDPYDSSVAKIRLDAIEELADRPKAKYVVVSAITPTPLEEGRRGPPWAQPQYKLECGCGARRKAFVARRRLLAAMSHQNLEDLLQGIESPVELLRNAQIGPYAFPGVPEFTKQITLREVTVAPAPYKRDDQHRDLSVDPVPATRGGDLA